MKKGESLVRVSVNELMIICIMTGDSIHFILPFIISFVFLRLIAVNIFFILSSKKYSLFVFQAATLRGFE
jgi:uncharacterized membrane protein